jgi:hypothetical protein
VRREEKRRELEKRREKEAEERRETESAKALPVHILKPSLPRKRFSEHFMTNRLASR